MLTFAVRLILEDNGKMLFLRQTKRNGGRYSLVGGNVEFGYLLLPATISRESSKSISERMAQAHVEL